MQQPIEFKKIREFGEIIGDTFLFIRQNFKSLMKALLYLCGLFLLGGLVSNVLVYLQLSDVFGSEARGQIDNPFSMIYNFSMGYLVVMVFYMLSYVSIYVTVLSYIAVYIQKKNTTPTMEEVWSYFKYYFFRVMGSGILMFIFMLLCFLCCVLPMLYVLPAVTIFFPILVLENAGFSYAFNRAFNLVKENWWITFGTIIVIGIIAEACKYIIQVPAIIIAWASAFSNLEQPITKTYAIVTSVAQFASFVFMIIPIIAAVLIYFNLVERKESIGLMDRIGGFGQAPVVDDTQKEEY